MDCLVVFGGGFRQISFVSLALRQRSHTTTPSYGFLQKRYVKYYYLLRFNIFYQMDLLNNNRCNNNYTFIHTLKVIPVTSYQSYILRRTYVYNAVIKVNITRLQYKHVMLFLF